MTILQKQADLGRTIFEINQNTVQELTRLGQENIKGYFELNSNFSKKLPEVSDITSFVELQREYSETLWNGVKEATRVQADVVKSAVEETGEAVRNVFATQSEG